MFIAVAAALLGVAQTEPLDTNVACIVGRVPTAARTAIIGEALRGEGGPARRAFSDAAADCNEDGTWSDALTNLMVAHGAAIVLRQETTTLLGRAGISVEIIDAWFSSLPPESRSLSEAEDRILNDVHQHLIAQGVPQERVNSHADEIGLYVGARLAEEEITALRGSP